MLWWNIESGRDVGLTLPGILGAELKGPLKPLAIIQPWGSKGFRWPLILPPWCREKAVFRTAIRLIIVVFQTGVRIKNNTYIYICGYIYMKYIRMIYNGKCQVECVIFLYATESIFFVWNMSEYTERNRLQFLLNQQKSDCVHPFSIDYSIFWFIRNQTEYRSASNNSENDKYNLVSFDLGRIRMWFLFVENPWCRLPFFVRWTVFFCCKYGYMLI